MKFDSFLISFFQAGSAPTPPDSNKPATNSHDHDPDEKTTHLKQGKMAMSSSSKYDPTGNLPHDQLAKMFPTPPSHEHNQITSPAEVVMDIDHHHHHTGLHLNAAGVKVEPGMMMNPGQDLMDWSSSTEDASLMLSSSIFAPLVKLYSDDFAPIVLSAEMSYKPRLKSQIW